jgi:hypothetical protein
VTATMRIAVDPAAVSMAEAIGRLSGAVPLFLVSHRAFRDLAAELGGWGRAADFLRELGEANDRPLAVTVEAGAGASRTAFIAPKHWTSERLLGWVAGHHELLERELGPIEWITSEGRR